MGSVVKCEYLLFIFALVIIDILAPIKGSAETFHILAFGDSITQGWKRTSDGIIYGITSSVNGLRTNDGYEPELEKKISTQTQHTAYVYNWGKAGERSYEGVNRLDTVLNSRSADFILIMEGANDLYEGVSAATTKANLRIMIQKSLARSVEPIIGTVTPNTRISTGYIIPAEYNPAINSLANEQNILLAEQYTALVGNWANYTSGDGLHLNDIGEQIMAQTWLSALQLSQPFLDATVDITPILKQLLLK